MQMKQGELLRKTILSMDLDISKVAKDLDINRGTLYQWFKKDTLDEYYIDKLKRMGIVIGDPIYNVPSQHPKVVSIAPKKQGLQASFSITANPFPSKEDMTKRTLTAIDLLGENGITTYQINKDTGIPHQTFINARKGTQDISQNVIKKLCERYGISSNYIMNGIEPILIKNDLNQVSNVNNSFISQAHTLIPLYDMDKMNRDLHVFKEGEQQYVIDNIEFPLLRNATGAWQVMGNDMEPKYERGCYVITKLIKDRNLIIYGKPYYIRTKESLIMRYVRRSKSPDMYLLVPENRKDYDEQEIPISEIQEIYSVRAGLTIESY